MEQVHAGQTCRAPESTGATSALLQHETKMNHAWRMSADVGASPSLSRGL